jgi:outer membrane protein assembly factor BamA
VALDYGYNRLPVDFGLHFFYAVVPRGGYQVNNQSVSYNEINTGITSSVSYTHQEAFAYHTVGLSFSAAHFQGKLPIPADVEPYAPVIPQPPSGNINIVHVGYGYSSVEGSLDAAGPARGFAFNFGVDYASQYTGSSYTVRNVNGGIAGYLSMPWRGHQTLALRAAGGISGGGYPRNGAYYVGGYDLANNSLPSAVLSGVFNGSFVLRGYPPGVYSGSEYVLANAEYRFPLAYVDRGPSTLPIYLRRLDGNVFVDYGGAFNDLDLRDIRFFHHGALIDSGQLHAAVGAELWIGLTLGFVLDTQLRLGYAYGFSAEAFKGGQPYLVASSAF